jgi:hypothetical protein
MARKEETGEFRLDVPLDASGIEDFKPEQPVKVLALAGDRPLASQTVKLDAKGNGTARLTLSERPGALRVIVGPHDASDEELAGLQTINVNVSARQWLGKRALQLTPILIPPYYWHWWFIWCRTFTIRGVVRCPDGSPVPGAKVCAYDVDWIWKWVSKQIIKCAITDANGAFEIKFRWCCGWWPWWWWRLRYWQFEPLLAQRINPILQRDPRLAVLAEDSPQPSLAAFASVLSDEGVLTDPASTAVDPAALSGLRDKLLKRLPTAVELERLHLWPWWPWYPWWDCTPDVIFKVTQECAGSTVTIVDETIFDTRWDIPTTLNVTLTANSQACCVPPLHPCIDGECLAITEVCRDVVDTIGGNTGALPAPIGYKSPGAISTYGDRPYGGNIDIYGTADCMSGVDYYEFEWTTTPLNPASWAAMPPAASGDFDRTYLEFSPFGFHGPTFSAQLPIDGRHVYETIQHYEANNVPADWASGDRLWLGSSRDLLTVWRTDGNFADDTYYLRVKGWNIDGAGHLINPRVLKICESTTDNFVVLRVDNRIVGAGPTDLHGNPCGGGTVHTCTNEPDTAIVAVKILHNYGTESDVSACGNVHVKATDWLQIDFVAHDPNGHLAMYSLQATYDVNLANDLLSLPSATLSASPVAVAGVPPAAQVGPNYAAARLAGAVAPTWTGGVVRLKVKATGPGGAFPYTCCYQLELRGHKRTIVNCDHSLWGHTNLSEYSFTIVV